MRLTRRQGLWLLLPAVLLIVFGLAVPLAYFLRFGFAAEAGSGVEATGFTATNFIDLVTRPYYRDTLVRTFVIALGATALTMVLGLAVAKLIADATPKVKALLIIVTVFPLLVGNVVRSIGWVALLGYDGALNTVLTQVGLLVEPLGVLRTPVTVAFAIMAVELPMMVLTLHASMELVGDETTRAAQSLGAGPLQAFFTVALPQIVPGLVTGGALIFVDSVNSYASPVLVGGSQVPMVAPEIYDSVVRTNNWPQAASLATLTMAISVCFIAVYSALLMRRFRTWSGAAA